MAQRSKELSETISRLIYAHPFFAVVLLDLLELQEADIVPRAATDGKVIYTNPEWFNPRPLEERVFVLAHEVSHVILLHPKRMRFYMDRGFGPDLKKFSPNRWNQAADYNINDWLAKSNVGRMPMGGLHHPNYGMNDLVDEIYKVVPEDPNADDNWDEHLPSNPNAAVPSQVQRAVKSAAQAAKSQGKTPANMARIIDEICEPQISWTDRIKSAIHRVAGKDTATWQRPHRRRLAVPPHIYWPGTESHQVGKVVMIGDSSGSVSDKEWAHFFGEMCNIMTEMNPSQAWIGDCDTVCHGPFEVTDIEDIRTYKPKGGGGTHMPAIFDKLKQEHIYPDALIILTDMYTDFGQPPGYPVIWVSTTKDIQAPHGETISISVGR